MKRKSLTIAGSIVVAAILLDHTDGGDRVKTGQRIKTQVVADKTVSNQGIDIATLNRFHLFLHLYCRENMLDLAYAGPLARGGLMGGILMVDSPSSYLSWQIVGLTTTNEPGHVDWFEITVSDKKVLDSDYQCQIGEKDVYFSVHKSKTPLKGSEMILGKTSIKHFSDGFVNFVLEHSAQILGKQSRSK